MDHPESMFQLSGVHFKQSPGHSRPWPWHGLHVKRSPRFNVEASILILGWILQDIIMATMGDTIPTLIRTPESRKEASNQTPGPLQIEPP